MLPPYRHSSSLEDPLILSYLPEQTEWSGKIAYLDRDGVLNRWKEDYVNSPDDLELLIGSGKAVASLRKMGFRICVVTNQSPIGRGLWGHEVLAQIHEKLHELLLDEDPDAVIDLILYSPYSPTDASWSRKPNPGMLEAGRQLIENAHRSPGEQNLLLFGDHWKDRPSESDSILVGDRKSDIIAAERFGVRGILCDSYSGLAGVISEINPIKER
jgi:histidinol-phosphate phosphatase family protein